HLAKVVAKVVPVALREIVQLMLGRIHAAGRHHVQKRLPQMRAAPLDQRNLGEAPLAERVAEMGGELEARGAAADDHNSVWMVFAHTCRLASTLGQSASRLPAHCRD